MTRTSGPPNLAAADRPRPTICIQSRRSNATGEETVTRGATLSLARSRGLEQVLGLDFISLEVAA